MEPSVIKFSTDIRNKIFLLNACETNELPKKLSDYDFFLEEYNGLGNWEDVFGDIKDLKSSTIYTANFRIDGGWDYEHVEYDYDIILTNITKEIDENSGGV